MSAFDEIIYGAKKCLDAATVKTNEFIEASRIQIEKSQLNCELKEEYIKLGKAYYEMTEKGFDQSGRIKASISKISDLLDDIKLAKENFSSDKIIICENCGTKNSVKFDYCSKCGNKLN